MIASRRYAVAGLGVDVALEEGFPASGDQPAPEPEFVRERPCERDRCIEMLLRADTPLAARGRRIFSQPGNAIYRDESHFLLQRFGVEEEDKPYLSILIDGRYTDFDLRFDLARYRRALRALDPTAIAAPPSVFHLAINQSLLHPALINRGGLAIHGAGGSIQGKGMIFAAPSGTGKSTLARLLMTSPGNRLFSEERMAAREIGGTWDAWGTPWHGSGEIARNERAPLAALVFLRQAKNTGIAELSPFQGLQRLMQVVCIPWYSAEWTERGLALCERLLRRVPAYELAFSPDHSAVRAVEALATGPG